MDHGPPDPKRPRLSTGRSWSAGGSLPGVSLLHHPPSPTTGQLPHHAPPSTQYQQPSPHSFSHPPRPGDPHPPPPPPPPPPAPSQTPIDDRRQHEGDRFPPMQEHRQLPHSPAHPSFPPYPPREPMIKADPAEDTLPHLRRPLSTGGSVQDNMTPVTPHSAVTPQPPPYGDDRRHMSYDNGPQPPSLYRQPSYQPQTPLPHPQPYDYPPQYPPHGELPYPIQVATATGKRKAQRASQACDNCRQLKAKCDELKPCKSCKEKNVECKYREAVPKQQDKMTADILETLQAMRSEFGMLSERMGRLENAVKRVAPQVDAPTRHGQDEDERPESAASAPHTAEDGYSSSPGDTVGTHAPINSLDARTITRDMEQEKEVEPGPFVRPGVPSIPPNHTTLAAFLLKWEPIEALVQSILDAENVKYINEFPIRQEERRGLLRIWGRGEGMDSSRVDREAIRDAGVMEIQDDISESGAPSPADCWGGISGSPGPIDGKPVITTQILDFTEAHVWKYVQSFQDNIQNMHPLIIPRELNAMVKLFLDSLQQNPKQTKNPVAKFVAATPSETGSKRKRSPAPDSADSTSTTPKTGRPTFQRSINNALVLLVLALGKICLNKDKIPDVVPVSEPLHGSPVARNGYPASPIHSSSPSHPPQTPLTGAPSPREGSADRPSPSRRSSFQSGGQAAKAGVSLRRNMDVIPGLDYFAYATDIMGGQLAGTSLRHIHAYLLAGLYHGQLGRVLESYAYIKEAGYALQVKMRPSVDRFRKLKEASVHTMHLDENAVTDKADNQLVFAFWTCLQLESDIIAELPLPQSHILAYEDMMPYPNLALAKTHGFDGRVLSSYLAQLYLRKSLNSIHGMLYNPDKEVNLANPGGAPGGDVLEYIENSLDMRFVPQEFKFRPEDPPAKDILSARLRAKYWGAQVITYRHFVREILDFNFKKNRSSEPRGPVLGGFRSGINVPMISPNAKTMNDISLEFIECARKGVKALIESTRAFHGLEEKRFIVTNVFGTSHAQWGNVITLAAVYKDPMLSSFIDEKTLKTLFAKTIAFFRVIAYPTSALAIDLRILEGLERKLFGGPVNLEPTDSLTRSSFSSSAGAPVPPAGPPMPVASPLPVASPMPPVSTPVALTSHANHVDTGMAAMSPPTLPPPMPATMSGPVMGLSPVQNTVHHHGTLPPIQHQRPH